MASNCAGFAFMIRQWSAGSRLMLWLFLFAVKIAETVRFQVDKILIGAEALRRVIDLVEEVAVLRFRFKHADLWVSRRSFGRNAAHLADHAAELRRLHELSRTRPRRSICSR